MSTLYKLFFSVLVSFFPASFIVSIFHGLPYFFGNALMIAATAVFTFSMSYSRMHETKLFKHILMCVALIVAFYFFNEWELHGLTNFGRNSLLEDIIIGSMFGYFVSTRSFWRLIKSVRHEVTLVRTERVGGVEEIFNEKNPHMRKQNILSSDAERLLASLENVDKSKITYALFVDGYDTKARFRVSGSGIIRGCAHYCIIGDADIRNANSRLISGGREIDYYEQWYFGS